MKKVLSIILAVIMVIGVMPFSVFATDGATVNEWETGLDDSAIVVQKIVNSNGGEIQSSADNFTGSRTIVDVNGEKLLKLDLSGDAIAAGKANFVYTKGVKNVFGTETIGEAGLDYDFSNANYIAVRIKINDNNPAYSQVVSLLDLRTTGDGCLDGRWANTNVYSYWYDIKSGTAQPFYPQYKWGYWGFLSQGDMDGYYIFNLSNTASKLKTDDYWKNAFKTLQIYLTTGTEATDKKVATSWTNKELFVGDIMLIEDLDKWVNARQGEVKYSTGIDDGAQYAFNASGYRPIVRVWNMEQAPTFVLNDTEPTKVAAGNSYYHGMLMENGDFGYQIKYPEGTEGEKYGFIHFDNAGTYNNWVHYVSNDASVGGMVAVPGMPAADKEAAGIETTVGLVAEGIDLSTKTAVAYRINVKSNVENATYGVGMGFGGRYGKFASGTALLYNLKTRTTTEVAASGNQFAIPAGFDGYLIATSHSAALSAMTFSGLTAITYNPKAWATDDASLIVGSAYFLDDAQKFINAYATCDTAGHIMKVTGETFANCTENGEKTLACEFCDHTEVIVTPAYGHSYSAVVTDPTCTDAGFTTYTCSCGDSYIGDETEALGHDYYEAERVDSTCTEAGYVIYLCSVCEDMYEEELPYSHEWVYTSTVEPNGLVDGYDIYTCSVCGETKNESNNNAIHKTGLDDTAVLIQKVEDAEGNPIQTKGDYYYGTREVVDVNGEKLLKIDVSYDAIEHMPHIFYTFGPKSVYGTKTIGESGVDYDFSKANYIAIRIKIEDNNPAFSQVVSYLTMVTTGDGVLDGRWGKDNLSYWYDIKSGTAQEFIPNYGFGYYGLVSQGDMDGYYIFNLSNTASKLKTDDYWKNAFQALQINFNHYTDEEKKSADHVATSWENKEFYLGEMMLIEDLDKWVAARDGEFKYTTGINDGAHYAFNASEHRPIIRSWGLSKSPIVPRGSTTATSIGSGNTFFHGMIMEGGDFGYEIKYPANTTETGTGSIPIDLASTYDNWTSDIQGGFGMVSKGGVGTVGEGIDLTKKTAIAYRYNVKGGAEGNTYPITVRWGDSRWGSCVNGTVTLFDLNTRTTSSVSASSGVINLPYGFNGYVIATSHQAAITALNYSSYGINIITPNVWSADDASLIVGDALFLDDVDTFVAARQDCDNVGHELVLTGEENVDPTCTEAGVYNYACKYCDYTETQYPEALGHKYENEGAIVTVEATCDTDGLVTKTCDVCGTVEETKLYAPGHNYVVDEETYVEADCTTDGYKKEVCTNCGDEIITETPAGHIYESETAVVTTEPTCTEAGYTRFTCDVCGESFDEPGEAALGHDEVVTTVDATCTEAGSKTTTCTRCDYTVTETIDALGHDFVAGEVVPPQVGVQGYTVYTCSVCGATENRDFTDALPETPEVPSDIVTNVTLTTTDVDMTLTWDKFPGATLYWIKYYVKDQYGTTAQTVKTTDLSFALTYKTLSYGTEYAFKVMPQVGSKYPTATDLNKATEVSGSFTLDKRAVNHKITYEGKAAILNFDIPENASTKVKYVKVYNKDTGANVTTVQVANGSTTARLINDLVPGIPYYAVVSLYIAEDKAYMPIDQCIPIDFTIPLTEIVDYTVDAETPTSVRISWASATSKIYYYFVAIYEKETNTRLTTKQTKQTYTAFTGLKPNTEYEITIQASVQYKLNDGRVETKYYKGPNGDGVLPRVSYKTPDYSYVEPTVVAEGNNVTVSWDAAEAATSYYIYEQTATGRKLVKSVGKSVTSYSFEAAAGEHIYGVAVCIKNYAGTSYAPTTWAEAVVVG